MSEWLKEHAWKACVGETLPWVRIPPSPPYLLPSYLQNVTDHNFSWCLAGILSQILANLALARENQRKAGIQNVEFLKGEIENIPLPDNSVDVIISNCVINLAADKDRVLREAFRVLKPGGRFAVSDVVARGEIMPDIRRSIELWAGCVAGALEESEYRFKLAAAGFEAIQVEPTRIYRVEDARQLLASGGIDVDAIAPLVDEKFMSAFVRARKPVQ